MKKYFLMATTTLLWLVVILFTPYTYSSTEALHFNCNQLDGFREAPTSEVIVDVPAKYGEFNITSIGNGDAINFNSPAARDLIVGLNLKEATNLQSIIKCSFQNCSNLGGELTLPASLTKIGSKAFLGTQIEKVYVNSNITVQPDSFPDTTVFVFKTSDDIENFKTTNASENWVNLNERLITTSTSTTENQTHTFGESIDLTINESGDYIWYRGDEQIDTSKSIRISGLKVGTYTYSYEVYNDNKLVKTHTYFITIEKAEVSLTFNDTLLEYTGSSLTLPFNTNLSYITNNYFDVQYNYFTTDYIPVSSIINAGKYKMIVNVKSEFLDNINILSDNCYNFTVAKKIIDVEWNIANSIEYNENIDIVEFNPVVDYANCKLLKLTNNETETYEESVFGTGRWKAVLTLKDTFSTNYELSSTEKKFSVLPSELTIVWPSVSEFSYNGTTINVTPTLYHKDNSACSNVNLTYSADSVLITANAGKYAVKVIGLNNPNYKLASGAITTFSWKISQKTIEVRWSNYTLYYNGLRQAPKALALDNGLIVDLEVMGAEIDANEGSANAYVATAKLSGSNQNYELKNATTTYYILKKSETLILNSNLITQRYNGQYILPSYTYDGEQQVMFSAAGVMYPSGVKEVGEYVLKVYTEDTKNIKGNEALCVIRILPAELTAKNNDVMVEVEGLRGFEIGAKLTIGVITANKSDTSLSAIGNDLNLIKMIKLGLQNNESQSSNVETIRFKLNNVDTSKLHIFTLNNGSYNECNFNVENGYIVIKNSDLGTYAFMMTKSNWFAETGIWLFSILAVAIIFAVVIVVTFKKPIKEKLERKMVSTVEKVYEESYAKKSNEELKKNASKHHINLEDDDEEDFNNMHDGE